MPLPPLPRRSRPPRCPPSARTCRRSRRGRRRRPRAAAPRRGCGPASSRRAQLLADDLGLVAVRVQAALGDPPVGPLLHGRVEEDLEARVGQDDGADVPAGHDDPAVRRQRALALEQRRPDLGDARHGRHGAVDGIAADRSVASSPSSRTRVSLPVPSSPRRHARGERHEGGGVVERGALAQRHRRHRAVDEAGVTKRSPSRAAAAAPTELLPLEAGPSSATTIRRRGQRPGRGRLRVRGRCIGHRPEDSGRGSVPRGAGQPADLGLAQRPHVARRHRVQAERPDPDPDEAPDRRPDLAEHAPQLALPALVDGRPGPR